MTTYEKTFVNPLLAMAFIDGLLYTCDPDIECKKPVRKSANEWLVVIMDHNEDDEVEENEKEPIDAIENNQSTSSQLVPIKSKTIVDISEPIKNNMEPVEIKAKEPERTIEIEADYEDSNKCPKCKNGGFGICESCGAIVEPDANEMMNIMGI
jgi:hypothetical protein